MRSPLQLRISQSASAQIDEAAGWWAQNRAAAPGAVREDLGRVLALLSVEPGIGMPARSSALKDVRRVTLSRIRYYLYYRVSRDALEVLAFWHTSRGRPPDL